MFVRGNISMTDKLQKLENAVKLKKKNAHGYNCPFEYFT